MADKNIKKDVKKKKKKTEEVSSYVPLTYDRPVITQPELIKKKKKDK